MSKLRCEGWWEQQGLGRQPMEDLQIAFHEGQVSGSGRDIVGAFTLSGQLQGERALLVKHYLGSHRVDYPGSFDGEGTLQGLWSIDGFGGKWMIHVARDAEANSNREVAEIQDWPPAKA
ncbi:hypothetical protein Poly24_27110 [Rosistilla carotiformis]|uniref:Uncharacterized protein n=1 Tax=Rosistilla carotiformis TaxID=2528017 RepID=A0A518JTX9_9BACT|nr:hypothetical protein [Rosistilla carotiformis]QDV68998.1 hypothetical protein Poly24_27110 [Rosistilla carotiformis]